MKNDLGALMLWIDRKLNKNQDTIVTKIDSIQNLFETSAEATASSSDIMEGKTAYNGTVLMTGTMENQGAKEATLLAGGTYNIPRGYHDGSGRVTATDLASQTPGTAGAGGILEGLKAWVAGKLVNGSMKDRRGTTVDAGTVTQDDEYTYLSIPEEACFDSNSKVRTENSNIASAFDNRCMCCGVNSESHKWEVVWADQGVVYTSARLVDTNLSAMRFIITYESTYAICRVIARKKGVFKFGSVSFGVNNPSIPLTENVVDNGADILNIRLDVNSAAPASFYCEFVR